MTVLPITDELRDDLDKLRQFAERPDNWQLIDDEGTPNFVTGDKPDYCVIAFDYRIVFSITHWPARRPSPVRYMTVSIRSKNYPLPVALFTIAHMLGFTNVEPNEDGLVMKAGENWGIGINEDEHCVIVQQDFDGGN